MELIHGEHAVLVQTLGPLGSSVLLNLRDSNCTVGLMEQHLAKGPLEPARGSAAWCSAHCFSGTSLIIVTVVGLDAGVTFKTKGVPFCPLGKPVSKAPNWGEGRGGIPDFQRTERVWLWERCSSKEQQRA